MYLITLDTWCYEQAERRTDEAGDRPEGVERVGEVETQRSGCVVRTRDCSYEVSDVAVTFQCS